jgi:hypothetical protein
MRVDPGGLFFRPVTRRLLMEAEIFNLPNEILRSVCGFLTTGDIGRLKISCIKWWFFVRHHFNKINKSARMMSAAREARTTYLLREYTKQGSYVYKNVCPALEGALRESQIHVAQAIFSRQMSLDTRLAAYRTLFKYGTQSYAADVLESIGGSKSSNFTINSDRNNYFVAAAMENQLWVFEKFYGDIDRSLWRANNPEAVAAIISGNLEILQFICSKGWSANGYAIQGAISRAANEVTDRAKFAQVMMWLSEKGQLQGDNYFHLAKNGFFEIICELWDRFPQPLRDDILTDAFTNERRDMARFAAEHGAHCHSTNKLIAAKVSLLDLAHEIDLEVNYVAICVELMSYGDYISSSIVIKKIRHSEKIIDQFMKSVIAGLPARRTYNLIWILKHLPNDLPEAKLKRKILETAIADQSPNDVVAYCTPELARDPAIERLAISHAITAKDRKAREVACRILEIIEQKSDAA